MHLCSSGRQPNGVFPWGVALDQSICCPVSPSIQCPCTTRQLESHDLRGPQCSDLCDISSSHSSESRSLLAPAREMTGGGIYSPAITGSLARWMTTTAEWFILRLCRAMPSCDLRCFLVYSSALSSWKKKKKKLSCWGQNHVPPHRVGIITFKCEGITKWPHFGCTLEIYKERTGREQQEEE